MVAGLGCYRHFDCFACCKHCAGVDFFCHLATIKRRRLHATLQAVPAYQLATVMNRDYTSYRERFVHCKLTVKLTDALDSSASLAIIHGLNPQADGKVSSTEPSLSG